MSEPAIEIRPVTAENWELLDGLFARHGTVRGCWCMYFRLTGREYREGWGEGNRAAMCRLVCDEGVVPGLIALEDGEAVGWVSLAPREEYPRVLRSRVTKPMDDEPAWSIVCFYVKPGYRRRGLTRALLDAAVDHAAAQGARLIEGYPYDTGGERRSGIEMYYGTESLFRAAGFKEVERRSERRPIMRLRIAPEQ
jgi:GNAT superfamily N-acetyltransferase